MEARMASVADGTHRAAGPKLESVAFTRDALRVAAVAMTALAAAAFLAGVFTPVPGGGFCAGSCAAYPFDDPVLVRDFVPVSFYWMYPAIGMLIAVVVFVASLTAVQRSVSRLLVTLALAFTVIGTSILLADYAIQLAVVAPSLLHGEGAAVVGLSLFNPHGVFVALEDVGYWVLGFAFIGVAAALGATSRAERIGRYVFLVGGVLAVGALPILIVALGPDLGYTYEIVVITVVDLTVAVGGGCAAFGLARPDGGRVPADAVVSRTA
jgi:hypothetical protein